MKKQLLFLFAITLFLTGNVFAQTLINGVTYRFNAANTASAVTINQPPLIGSGQDGAVSAVTQIGFEFWFAGTKYTQFSVTEDGLMKLGGTVIVSEPVNSMASGTNLPKIAPYWDDLTTGTTGNVGYQLTGTAPNQILRVKWTVNNAFPKNIGAAPNSMFQVELYEATGSIHFAFGPTMPPIDNGGYSMGVGVSSTDFASITTPSSCAYGIAKDNNTAAPAPSGTKRYQFGTDYTAPAFITPTAIANTPGIQNRTMTSGINDVTPYNGTGVPIITGSLVPRIYYKRTTDATYVSNPGTLNAGGTSIQGTWSFTVDHSLLPGGSANPGDQIQYFLIAQDQSVALGHPNISSYPAGVVATDVNNITTLPATTNSYIIGDSYSGTVTVGSGGNFTSLTNPGGLFDLINAGELTGNLTVNITTDLTAETGAKPLNAWINNGGTYTMTINPVGNRIISGATFNGGTANLISLIGATGLIVDGLNTGGNSLTITQTGQYLVGSVVDLKGTSNTIFTNLTINGYGASNYAISITNATSPINAPASDNTISYCNITNPVNTSFIAGNGIGLPTYSITRFTT